MSGLWLNIGTNCNKETGIRYGVIQGDCCPDLLEEIYANGDSLSWQDFKLETIATLASLNCFITL